ncbi:hypothetical protein WKV44_06695 [Spirochaetia bacterium 38H-sp]|uniref:Capsule assembly protein Wzi n=1 Tax=Rarispira pelagica TaxID=3141764 RepID=A0ABU9UCQ0_9SPIR
MNKTSLFLFLLINTLLYAQMAPSFSGTYPVIENEKWTGIKFELTPQLAFGSLPSELVKTDYWDWGMPVNPAERVFYLQEQLEPFFNIKLSGKAGKAGIYMELPLQKEYNTRLTDFYSNFFAPYDGLLDISKYSVDMTIPQLAYIYYQDGPVFFSIGRYPLKWGDARYPVVVSPVTYQDNLSLVIDNNTVRYSFGIISSFPYLADKEYDIQTKCYDEHSTDRIYSEPYKTIALHRLDIKSDSWRLGIGELNVIGGKFPDLIDISPVVIFHNTYGEGYSNVLMSLDASIVPISGLKIYGELAADDASFPTTEKGSDYKPGAWAYNIGAEYTKKEWGVWLEYDHTDQWMYTTSYLPYLHISVRHFYIDNQTAPKRMLAEYPLGFAYGPDADMISVGGFFNLSDIQLTAEYNFIIKGTVVDGSVTRWKWLWDGWPTSVVSTDSTLIPEALPAGDDEYINKFYLSASWKKITLFSWLIAEKNISWLMGINYKIAF